MSNYVLLSFGIAILLIGIFFFTYERKHPQPRDIMPIVIMCVISSLSRVIFSFIPQIQPSTAIIIIMGVCYGKQIGFMTGAMTAIVSNMVLGQGPWTIWQVLAWGIIGLIAGWFPCYNFIQIGHNRTKIVQSTKQVMKKYLNIGFIAIYAFFSAFLFSIIIDIWTVSTLGSDLTLPMIISVFTAGIIFNIGHAIGNVLFFILLYPVFTKKFQRLKLKYGILNH